MKEKKDEKKVVYLFDNRYNNDYRWLSGIFAVWKRYGCVWFLCNDSGQLPLRAFDSSAK